VLIIPHSHSSGADAEDGSVNRETLLANMKKIDPAMGTIGGTPIYDINGNQVDARTWRGLYYTEEYLSDCFVFLPDDWDEQQPAISWVMNEIISEPKEAKDGI
jgi:hypothetical protein